MSSFWATNNDGIGVQRSSVDHSVQLLESHDAGPGGVAAGGGWLEPGFGRYTTEFLGSKKGWGIMGSGQDLD